MGSIVFPYRMFVLITKSICPNLLACYIIKVNFFLNSSNIIIISLWIGSTSSTSRILSAINCPAAVGWFSAKNLAFVNVSSGRGSHRKEFGCRVQITSMRGVQL
jgi:hypothetical protein